MRRADAPAPEKWRRAVIWTPERQALLDAFHARAKEAGMVPGETFADDVDTALRVAACAGTQAWERAVKAEKAEK